MEANQLKTGYGISHTVEETAAYLGISRQRVMMIERNALNKLRKLLQREYGVSRSLELL